MCPECRLRKSKGEGMILARRSVLDVSKCTIALCYATILCTWLYRDFGLSFCLEKLWYTAFVFVSLLLDYKYIYAYIYALTPLHDAAGNAILGAVNFENCNWYILDSTDGDGLLLIYIKREQKTTITRRSRNGRPRMAPSATRLRRSRPFRCTAPRAILKSITSS